MHARKVEMLEDLARSRRLHANFADAKVGRQEAIRAEAENVDRALHRLSSQRRQAASAAAAGRRNVRQCEGQLQSALEQQRAGTADAVEALRLRSKFELD